MHRISSEVPRSLRTLRLCIPSASEVLRSHVFSRSSFTVTANPAWQQDLLKLPSVTLRQEVSDWERAAEIGMGAVVWPAALAFCELVDSEFPIAESSFWNGLRVLELGAGCGAAGLAVAVRNAEVTLTDRESVLGALEHNVQLNAPVSAKVRLLRWEDASSDDFFLDGVTEKGYDVVLGTDLVDVDPDRTSGSDVFAALRRVFLLSLDTLPQALFITVFEERGPLRLESLGDLFAPLLTKGVLWEFKRPSKALPSRRGSSQLRFLCGHGGEEGSKEPSVFVAWRTLLEREGRYRFERLRLDKFSSFEKHVDV